MVLSKRMAENLSQYFFDIGIKAKYLHSDIDTLERVNLLSDFRQGVFDVLVGINLLREGINIPECSLVAILDADKEGFLRSNTALIQIMGRAARHPDGRAILYADRRTKALSSAIDETNRRRQIQQEYNEKHNITPKAAVSTEIVLETLGQGNKETSYEEQLLNTEDRKELLAAMKKAGAELDFELAAKIRDKLGLKGDAE